MHYFPGSVFAWIAFVSLVGLCLVAGIIDWKRFRIPNELVLIILGTGLLMNLIRGIWIGSIGETGPWLGWKGMISVTMECLLFSLAGFFLAFAILFVLWRMNACGGGDAKLFSAIGAWIGPILVLWLLGVQLISVVIFFIIYRIFMVISGKIMSRHMSFSMPLCLAVIGVLLWFWKADLFGIR